MSITLQAGEERPLDVELTGPTRPIGMTINSPQGQTSDLFTSLGADLFKIHYDDYVQYGYNQILSMILSQLSNPCTIYYAHNGHGDAGKFYWGNYERIVSSSRFSSAMRHRPPITFASLESCDSMKLAEMPTSFAYYLTKGFSPGSGVVGSASYISLSSDHCGYYGDTRDWFYDYLLRGYPVYKAYRLAVNKCLQAYEWDITRFFRYLGDQSPNFRLTPQQEFPEEEV